MTAMAASSIEHCIEWFERGATVVTATRRLARHLEERDAHHRRAEGASAWASPDVLTWDEWLVRTTRALDGEQAPVLLNETQELALWKQLIRDDLKQTKTEDVTLWQDGPAARAAHSAHAAVHEWCMQDMSRDAISDDARAFLRWQEKFEQWCRDHHCLDRAVLGTRLLVHLGTLRTRSPVLPEMLIVAGFAAHTPLREKLCTALAGLGVRIVSMAMPDVGSRVVRCQASDSEDELLRAASWCRQKLLAGTDTGTSADPPNLGVVISNMEGCRDQAARIFEQVLGGFDPGLGPVNVARLFHASLGVPLAEHPIVTTALEWLEWLSGEADFETFSRSVRSPFIKGAATERAARGRFDLELRQTVSARVTPALLRSALGLARIKKHMPLALGEVVHKLIAASTALDRPQSPAAWSVTFSEWLAIAGWPGERDLDSHEHQILKAWTESLERLASMSLLERACSARQAWLLVKQITSSLVFNPKAVPAPVQLLGVNEAAGLDFDALWVTGLTDDAWPRPPMPLPFLPVAEQRHLGMPEASWDASLKHARDTIARLKATAPEVVFSYSKKDDDEEFQASPQENDDREVRASPLIRDVPCAAADDLPSEIVRCPGAIGDAQGVLEQVSDDRGPALVSGGARVHGGASLFRDQAACPFRAFAVHRLGSETIQPARPALTAMDHGSMIHDILECLWQEWRTQDALKTVTATPDVLKGQIVAAIETVLDRHQWRNPGVMSRAARELQRHRLFTLLLTHLEFEAARPLFTVVECEKKLEQDFHGLGVRVRVDRIDEIADGKHILIDYKTGVAEPASWFGEYPKEPQLPLYRALLGDRVAGIAFARVRRGEDERSYLKGLCDETIAGAGGLNPVSESRAAKANGIASWSALVAGWDEVLKRLVQAIASGEAKVAPQPHACKYCDQQALCRIDERNVLNEVGKDTAADVEQDDE